MVVNKNVGSWSMDMHENVSVGNFNNISDAEKYGVRPAQNGDNAITVKNPDARPIAYREFNADEYQYYFYGKTYFYGIYKDGIEVISAVDSKGCLLDIYAGAGKFKMTERADEVKFLMTDIASFEEIEVDGCKAVKVWYNAKTDFRFFDEATVTYIFKKTGISIEMHLACQGVSGSFSSKNSYIIRECLNEPSVTKKRIAYNWIYPENNDFTYLDVDAVAISGEYDGIAVYTFCRDKNSDQRHTLSRYSCEKLPLALQGEVDNIDYTYNMDLVFIKATGEESYEALFKGRHMNFAAGIATVSDNGSSTFFMGKNVLFNINVTNISEADIEYGVRYNVINHYNEVVSSDTFYHNKLAAGEQANRNLDLKLDKYGMHYLNLYVTDGVHEYRECYHFAMLEEHDFKYRQKSPFGICATHTDNEGECDATADLLKKIGISSVRLGSSTTPDYLYDKLVEGGITTFSKGLGDNRYPDRNIDKFTQDIKEIADTWAERVDYFCLANEKDRFAKGNYDKCKRLIENDFYPYVFKPAYDYFSSQYPDKDVIYESNCHGTLEWFEAFYEAGLWDLSKVIDVHSYSSPSGPDKCFSNQLCSMFASMFSNEYAAVRWKRVCKRYGEKRLIVGETGYPTPPEIKQEIDIRTQADFNVRIALFFLEVGAEFINYYCLYDRVSFAEGAGKWIQMYFGACYNHDYYGIYMPKPWAAAYANLTRRLDGVDTCKFFDKYEEDEWGTLRAFEVTKKDGGKLAVLWSNIYMQPNTTAEGRVKKVERLPMPAWENRWLATETRIFDAIGDTVEVIDIMGNSKIYHAKDGKVAIEVSGSPIFVYGLKDDFKGDIDKDGKLEKETRAVGTSGIC